MIRICVYLILIVGITPVVPLFANQDAAVEIQEGDVRHWIEYYKKERGISNEAASEDKEAPKPVPQGTEESRTGAASSESTRTDPGD